MSNSIVVLLAIVSLAFLCNLADANCHKNDKHCCRKKCDYGRCHHHVRRYFYNVTCGQCQSFDYSGCGGDENNFNGFDECNDSCRGTSPCPKYSLDRPHHGCEYKWRDGHDGCPRPNLECGCPKTYCRPDACRHGERCIPETNERCHKCPCQQYRCVTDPCYAVKPLRSCERCVAVPAPHCHHKPCPLIAYRENHCNVEPFRHQNHHNHHRHHCKNYFACPPEGDSCHRRRCPAYPSAKCVVDPCDCRKHWWYVNGKSSSDDECNYGDK